MLSLRSTPTPTPWDGGIRADQEVVGSTIGKGDLRNHLSSSAGSGPLGDLLRKSLGPNTMALKLGCSNICRARGDFVRDACSDNEASAQIAAGPISLRP